MTASTVPVVVGAALAARLGHFSWGLLALTLCSGSLLQIATNMLNTYGDFKAGVDTPENPPTAPQLVDGSLRSGTVLIVGTCVLIAGTLFGVGAAACSDWRLLWFAVAGAAGAALYTTGVRYKYLGLGVPLVMLLMGTLMVLASFYAQTRTLNWAALVASLPVACHVGAILHGNDLRDIDTDTRAGIITTSMLLGVRAGPPFFVVLHAAPYLVTAVAVVARLLPPAALLTLLALPLSLGAMCAARRGETRSLEQRSAGIHFVFGVLLAAGLRIPAF